MIDATRWMIYGANGYTGRRIAEQAVALGYRPILAGRNREAVVALAASLDCPYRVFSLDSREDLQGSLAGLRLVLNCAGPFSQTARQMMEAYLKTGVHYLDIAGEIDVFELAASLDAEAQKRGVVLLPGVGFDVVPSDCLAAKLAASIDRPTHLVLAFTSIGCISKGTARTICEFLPKGGLIRQDGKLKRVSLKYRVREIPFPRGSKVAVTIPWGDVASAWYTTGIPNIEVYSALSRKAIRVMSWVTPLLSLGTMVTSNSMLETAIRNLLSPRDGNAIREPPAGHDRTSGVGFTTEVWGEVRNAAGEIAAGAMTTRDGYTVTVATSLASVQRILKESLSPGFTTPARAFGPDFIDSVPGVKSFEGLVSV